MADAEEYGIVFGLRSFIAHEEELGLKIALARIVTPKISSKANYHRESNPYSHSINSQMTSELNDFPFHGQKF